MAAVSARSTSGLSDTKRTNEQSAMADNSGLTHGIIGRAEGAQSVEQRDHWPLRSARGRLADAILGAERLQTLPEAPTGAAAGLEYWHGLSLALLCALDENSDQPSAAAAGIVFVGVALYSPVAAAAAVKDLPCPKPPLSRL